MQFLVKHNGSKGFLEKGDNLQEEVFSDDCRKANMGQKTPCGTHPHEK